MTEQEQIKEMAQIICGRSKGDICILDKTSCDNNCSWTIDAKALYDAGYQKIDMFAECRNCTAWSGTDCTRHPYTQGCLKDENNIKRQAVKEFAEKLKKIVFEQGNPYNVPYEEFSQANVLFMVIDELLKEYEE